MLYVDGKKGFFFSKARVGLGFSSRRFVLRLVVEWFYGYTSQTGKT